jgi:thymidylate synthase (FAD)
MNSIKVLDHGFVTLRNLAGPTRRVHNGPADLQGNDFLEAMLDGPRPFDADDADPANAARISFGNLDSDVVTLRDGSTRPRTRQDDYNLNRYLLANEHASPFEMIQVWIEWKVPIFVDRQFVRHGTIRRNEESARYTQLPAEWYIPEVVGGKAKDKKQGQADNLPADVQQLFKDSLDLACRNDYDRYTQFLAAGVAAEHARMFLHVNHYVHYITTVNLRNLMHFLRLRTHEHAQIEARVYAEAIVELVRPHLPQLMALFDELVRIKPAMTQEEAVELARSVAAKHNTAHGYLADSATDPNWLPHEWVVDAILAAASRR